NKIRRHGFSGPTGIVAVVPRAAAGQILALRDESVALALDQPRERDLALQPLELLVRDARHRDLQNRLSTKTLSRGFIQKMWVVLRRQENIHWLHIWSSPTSTIEPALCKSSLTLSGIRSHRSGN